MSKKPTETAKQGDIDLGEVYTRTELALEKNKKPITYGAIGLLVLVALVLGYQKGIAEPRAKEAADLIWKAQYYFEVDSLDKALNGDDQWPGFLTVAADFGSTPSGELAHYYAGAIYMQKGDYEQALSHFKEADLKDDVLSVMAIGNQGDALVELGRADEAAKLFEKAAGMAKNDFTTPMYLMKAGIVRQQAGEWKAAKNSFKRLADEFPLHPDASIARKYAGHAEAMGG
ncbi:MAG: tetratricopeptide repeat protein [Flavobacteriales bacterium]|nr:tetratricopeptide repeat protein [Flavobacteriales bacterium]